MDVKEFLEQYGLVVGIIVWLIVREGPNLINFIKDRFADAQEHQQTIKSKQVDTQRLDTLIAMGSKTFTEEQLTLMTSETQIQLAEANEYTRKEVSTKLDVTIQKLDTVTSKVDKLPETVLEDLRTDLRSIADNWKSAMLEYRHVQAKLAIMTTLLQDYYDSNKSDEREDSSGL